MVSRAYMRRVNKAAERFERRERTRGVRRAPDAQRRAQPTWERVRRRGYRRRPQPVELAVTVVQGAAFSGTTAAVWTPGSNATAGNKNIISLATTENVAPTIADVQTNLYTKAVSKIPPIDNAHITSVFWAPLASSGANAVTVTASTGKAIRGYGMEIAGLAASPVASTNTATGTGTALSAGSLTPTAQPGIIVAAYCTDGGAGETFTQGAGYTLKDYGSSLGSSQVQIFTTLTTLTTPMTMSASTEWAGAAVCFQSSIPTGSHGMFLPTLARR